jgi:hypothetical protein
VLQLLLSQSSDNPPFVTERNLSPLFRNHDAERITLFGDANSGAMPRSELVASFDGLG